MAKIHQPHDALLRRVFSTRKVVLALVKASIVQFYPELAAKATWGSFLLEKGSFLDEEMKKLYGDLVCSVMVEGKRIYLILEFESELKSDMPLRVHGYSYCTARDSINEKTRQLPIVLPIVIHVGEKAYNFAQQLMDVPTMLQSNLLKMPWVISIKNQTLQETMQYGKDAIALVIVNRAHQGSPLAYLEHTPEAAQLFRENQFGEYIARYIGHMETKDSKEGEEKKEIEIVKQRIAKLAANNADKIMSGLARIEEKSRQEGIQEGIQKGIQREKLLIAKEMLHKACSLDFVKDVTGLQRAELSRLQEMAYT